MATMRFHDEVTDPDDVRNELFEEKPGKPEKRELDMAKQLIESLSTGFEADKYRDEYREELLAMLERKAEGKEIVTGTSEEPEPTKAPDLMAALEESLAAVRGETDGAAQSSESNGGSNGAAKRKASAKKKPAAKKRAAKRKPKAKAKAKAGSK
jgi:DNA end-binding protein Ku